MKKLAAAAAAVLTITVCGLPVSAQPQPLLEGVQVGAQAAIVMEASTGRVAYWHNADRRLPMASTTKIMSSLIALEQPGLDETFIVDPNAIRVEGSSMGLREGDTVTLRALAAGMLLASGNDAAGAAAMRISGSLPAFVEEMNHRAARMGLKDTSFETPSGLDGEEHYSTAYDMAMMARQALRNEDFFEICSSSTLSVEYGNPPYKRRLSNHNRLLRECEGAIGVKTGFTKKSGRCLVSAAQREGITLIVVTLNASDDWNVHKNLYDQCFPLFERVQEPLPQELTSIPVGGGTAEEVLLEPSEFGGIVLAKEELGVLTKRVYKEPFALAPLEKGRVLGRVEYSISGIPVATQYLVAAQQVSARPVHSSPSLWERLRGLWKKK